MRVTGKTAFKIGEQTSGLEQADQNTKSEKRKSFFAGNLKLGSKTDDKSNMIEERKEAARQKAMKVVGDAFAREQKLDQGEQELEEHVREMKNNASSFQDEAAKLQAQKKQLMEEQGYTEESEEIRQLNTGIDEYQRIADASKNAVVAENSALRDAKLERLKTRPMLEATDQAEEINEAASEEVMGMLIQEAKDHIDEEREEEQEKADKKQKEEEKQEEQLAALKKKQEQLAAQASSEKGDAAAAHEHQDSAETEELTGEILQDASQANPQIQQQLEEITRKMNLILDDLKGIQVDNKA